VDADRSGSITVAELQNLAFGGVPLGFDIALKLIKVFDSDYSGSIEFNEYAALHKFIHTMQFAFTQADANRNGVLDANEIHLALQQAGFRINLLAVQALFRKHSKGQKEIGFSTFLGLVADVALLRTKFESFDAKRTGYITISLDSLIMMSADV
jgi:peflin